MPGPVLGARPAEMDDGPKPLLCGGLTSSGGIGPREPQCSVGRAGGHPRRGSGNTGWVSGAAERTEGQVTRQALAQKTGQ